MTITRKTSAQYRNAEARSADREKRTVDLVWSTGAAVLRRSYEGPYWEELSLDTKHVRLGRLNNRAPFLRDHNKASIDNVLGAIEPGTAKVDGKQGIATVRFPQTGVDIEADKVFEKIADRIITKVSVGYVVHVAEETTADSVGVPTLRAIDWEPFEVSAVAVGADDGATFRSTEQFHTTRVQRGERKHMDPEVEPKQPSPQPSIVETEKQRAIQIRHAVKVANLPAEYAERMISDGLTPEAARLQAFAALEARGNDINPTPGRADIEDEPRSTITVGDVPEDHFVRGASAWLLEKTGKREIVRKAQAAKARGFENINFDGGRFRGMSMLELAKESIRLRGGKIRSFDGTRIIGDALQVRGWNGVGAQGTGDFGNLLANVLNKVLMAQYALAPATWRSWCAEMSNQDFRAATHLQTGAFPTLPVVKEHEEYKHIQIPDASKIEVSTETRGGIMAISRQALVNDDMGYFTNIAQQMGLAAARSIESAAYAMLLENSGLGPTINGNPFFHSSRGNVGSAAQLSVAALDADRVLMTAQKDVNSVESLDLRPSVLLVPSSIGGLARAIVKAELEPELLQMPNRVEGLANVVDTGRLTGTRRYIFADPNVCPAFAIVFLDESRSPYFEQQESFYTDGVAFKVRHDFKANPFDPRGAVTNVGA